MLKVEALVQTAKATQAAMQQEVNLDAGAAAQAQEVHLDLVLLAV
jgi:hypothetical protein